MDMLNEMTTSELKAILKQHRKIHSQPYSKLKRQELIDLIVFYKLHETDPKKFEKVKRV